MNDASERAAALWVAATALTKRIAILQRAIEALEPPATLEQQLAQARGLQEALADALEKVTDVDPRARDACKKRGEMLDGLERVMFAGGT